MKKNLFTYFSVLSLCFFLDVVTDVWPYNPLLAQPFDEEHKALMAFWAIVCLWTGLIAYREYREEEEQRDREKDDIL